MVGSLFLVAGQEYSAGRVGLNEGEAPGTFVTARLPKHLAKPSSVSHALVSNLQKHRSQLLQFGSLHIR